MSILNDFSRTENHIECRIFLPGRAWELTVFHLRGPAAARKRFGDIECLLDSERVTFHVIIVIIKDHSDWRGLVRWLCFRPTGPVLHDHACCT